MSSLFSTEPSQAFEYTAVIVDDVDLGQRLVHARMTNGSVITVSFRDQPGGVTYVPQAGEKWIAVRKGYTWFLEAQIADDVSALVPGQLDLHGTVLTFNGAPVGGASVLDQFENPGSGFATAVLSQQARGTDKIHVYLNGLLLPTTVWSWDSGTNTITFTSTMGEAGFLEAVYEPA